MSLSFGLSPWLLGLCLALAAILTWWAYRRTVPRVSMGRRAVLAGLRFSALLIVLLLLFEPIWRRIERDAQPPVLAVLADDSQSLSRDAEQADAPLDLSAATRDAVRAVPEPRDGDRRFYAFDGETRTLASPDSLRFRGPRTDIAQALDYVRDELRDTNLGGVLLISDGQYNTGRNPLHVAERYPVPIYTIAVGDTARRRDVQIRRITTNEIAYVDTELPVQIGLRGEDFGGEQVVVSLLQNGAVLGSQNVTLPEGTAEVPVDLEYTPTEEGFQQLQVVVTRLPGEVTYRNNTDAVTVRVLENRRRVLVLGAAPSPDLAAVQQLLQQDPNVEVASFVQKQRGAFYEGTFPASLDAYDVIVLAGYPGPAADPGVMNRIADAAESGTPLLFLLTRQTDLRALRQHFAGVLPATPERERPTFAEAAFSATPRGQRHPILDRPASETPALRRLPPLFYNDSRWQTSPDARVLATIDVRGVALDDPLLVVRQRPGSRSAALLGAGTWRWRNLPEDLDALAGFWPNLFSNIMQWLTTPEDDRRVRVEPAQDVFGAGENVEFSGQVYDESLNPIDGASVTVRVTTSDGTELPFTMEAAGNGRYVLDAGTLPEGTYQYAAAAERDGADLGADQGTFAVGGVTLEFKETRADAALLRQIAQRSGGAFLSVQDLSELPSTLASSGAFQPVVFEDARETELRRLPWFLAAIVLLLTTEWFLRKRSGMV